MILVDTSVWIDHFRSGEPRLVGLLQNSRVTMHPFVLGEISCGNLKNRTEILKLLGDLPGTPVATNDEVLDFIERRSLMGRGIGYGTHTSSHRSPCPVGIFSGRKTGGSTKRRRSTKLPTTHARPPKTHSISAVAFLM